MSNTVFVALLQELCMLRGKRYLAEVPNIHKARVQGEPVCHVHEYTYYLQNQICQDLPFKS